MRNFEIESMADGYAEIVHAIHAEGEKVSPRGQDTRELTDVTVQLNDPSDVLLLGTNRARYRPEIGAAEALQLVAGISDPGLLSSITKTFKRFQDGGALHGAYGPRLRFQLPRIINRLECDNDTRQAVATIWDPMYDGAGDAEPGDDTPRDLPCTVYLSFRVRRGKLTMKTHMRSNDVWLGFPYDMIQFTTLQQTVANVMGIESGPYVHHADSLHLYERDVESALSVVRAWNDPRPLLTGIHADTWPRARLLANELIYAPGEASWVLDSTADWFNRTIEPYRAR